MKFQCCSSGTRRSFASFCCFALVGFLGSFQAVEGEVCNHATLAAQAESDDAVFNLEPDRTFSRTMDREEAIRTHFYCVKMLAGEAARIRIEQKGVDVYTKVFAPDGSVVGQEDTPQARRGIEITFFLAPESGSYRLEVSAVEAGRDEEGTYEIVLAQRRKATREDRHLDRALRTYWNIRSLLRPGAEGDVRRAAAELEQAIDWALAAEARDVAAVLLHDLATYRSQAGDPSGSLRAARRAAEIWEQAEVGESGRSLIRSYGLSSKIYSEYGEDQRALDYLRLAVETGRRIGGESHEYALAQWALGIRLLSLDDLSLALDAFLEARKIWRDQGHRIYEARALQGLGRTYERLGDYRRARESHLAELETRRSVVMPALRDEFCLAMLYAAKLAFLTEDPEAGHEHLHRSDECFSRRWGDERPNLKRAADRANLIADAYLAAGDDSAVLESYRSPSLESAPVLSRIKALARKALAEKRLGRLQEAGRTAESALHLLEDSELMIGDRSLWSIFPSGHLDDFTEISMAVRMEMHQREPFAGHDVAALEIDERGRARSLLRSLGESYSRIGSKIDRELGEKERRLRFQMKRTQDRKSRLEMLGALEEIQMEFSRRRPEYAALTRPRVLTPKDFQQEILGEGDLVLQYSLGTEHSYLWAVTETSLQSFQLPGRATIEAQARKVYDLLRTRGARERFEADDEFERRIRLADAELPEASAALSETILGPVLGLKEDRRRLILIADGILQYIPFAVLPSAQDDRPLIADHEIVSVPSLSVLAQIRNRETPEPSRGILVLADPLYGSGKQKGRIGEPKSRRSEDPAALRIGPLLRSRNYDELSQFSALPASRTEAESILALADAASVERSRGVYGIEANREFVLSGALAPYRILHFAAHGTLNSHYPELSGLVLSLHDQEGSPIDGFLRLHDIYSLRLRADLVVLSACETALGRRARGEGLIGLTRAFFYAGADTVVSSLWRVEDEATAELMKNFYDRLLQRGRSPSAALREAQLAMRRDGFKPYAWGGFIVQGEWNSRSESSESPP